MADKEKKSNIEFENCLEATLQSLKHEKPIRARKAFQEATNFFQEGAESAQSYFNFAEQYLADEKRTKEGDLIAEFAIQKAQPNIPNEKLRALMQAYEKLTYAHYELGDKRATNELEKLLIVDESYLSEGQLFLRYLQNTINAFREGNKKIGAYNFANSLILAEQMHQEMPEHVAYNFVNFAVAINHEIENPKIEKEETETEDKEIIIPKLNPEHLAINLAEIALSYASKVNVVLPEGFNDTYNSLESHRKNEKDRTKLGDFKDIYRLLKHADLNLIETVPISKIPRKDDLDEMTYKLINVKHSLEEGKYQFSREEFLGALELFRKHKTNDVFTDTLKWFGSQISMIQFKRKPKLESNLQNWMNGRFADFEKSLKSEYLNIVDYEIDEETEEKPYAVKKQELEELSRIKEASKEPLTFFSGYWRASRRQLAERDFQKEKDSELEEELQQLKFGGLVGNYINAMVSLQEANEQNPNAISDKLIIYCGLLESKVYMMREKYKPYKEREKIGKPMKIIKNGVMEIVQKVKSKTIRPEISPTVKKTQKRLTALGKITSIIGYNLARHNSDEELANKMQEHYTFFNERQNSEIPSAVVVGSQARREFNTKGLDVKGLDECLKFLYVNADSQRKIMYRGKR